MTEDNRITNPAHINHLSLELGKSWPRPKCGNVIPRKLLKQPDEGTFPDSYDYTIYESDGDFTLRIINHLATHIYI